MSRHTGSGETERQLEAHRGRRPHTNWLSAGLRPQAVVANDDEMAIGAIQALKQAKLLSRTIVAGNRCHA